MRNPLALLLYMYLGVALAAPAAPAAAAVLDLPVQRAGADAGPRSYAGDLLELRLTPQAARAALPRSAGPTRARQALRLGVTSVDAVSAALGGCTFEPEFVGETPPEDPGEPDFTAFWLVHLPPGAALEDALERFGEAAGVALALPVATLPVSAIPDDSLFVASTWLYQADARGHDLAAPEAWDVEDGDSSIVVAILDSGVLPYHPDLGGTGPGYGQMWTNWAEAAGLPGVDDDGNGFVDDWRGWDFVARAFSISVAGEDVLDADNDPNDLAGHGTAVAGLVGAIVNNGIGVAGVAPNVRLMPLRMAWQVGAQPGAAVSMTYAAQAIRYATRMGATIINASWESVDSTGSGLGTAVTAATRAGVAIANAAGNSFSSPAYLGNREDVISVARTDSNDVVVSPRASGAWVDVAAQGVAMVSTFVNRAAGTDSVASYRVPGYRAGLQGSSFAAPQAAGVMALLQAQRRAQGRDPLTPQGLLARLRETTDDIRPLNPGLVYYGTGRLNAHRALTDRPTTSAVRTLAQAVGAPVVLRANTGVTRVVYATTNQQIVAFDGATADTAWIAALPANAVGHLAVADFLDGAGPHVLVGTATGALLAFDENGAPGTSWPGVSGLGTSLAPGIASGDLDGDGVPEVVAVGFNGRAWVFRRPGVVLDGFPFEPGVAGGPAAALADLDGQPGDEIVLWSGDGSVHALLADGSEAPGWPYAAPAVGRAPVVARFAGPGAAPTVLLVSGNSLTALAGDGSLRWSSTLAANATSDLALGDLDGDGLDEIVVFTGTTIAVLDSNGVALPAHQPQGVPSAPAGAPVVGPLAPGGAPGIGARLAAGYHVWNANGQLVDGFPKPGVAGSWSALADLDADGATEIAAGTALSDSNVYAFDAGAGTWNESRAYWPAVRGDDARTGARRHPVGLPLHDRIAPAPVTDVVATALGATQVRITWTNTGDDGLSGRARLARVIRTSVPPGVVHPEIDVADPDSSGVADTLVIGAGEGQQLSIQVLLRDDAGNWSAAGNADTVLTPGAAPAAIADLRVIAAHDSTVVLAWTAPVDDGVEGRPVSYEIAGAPFAFDSSGFAGAPLQAQLVATVAAGSPESLAVSGLERGRRWTFAVRGVDGSGSRGGVSNLASVVLGPGGAIEGRPGIAIAARPVPGAPPITLDWLGDVSLVGPPQHLDLLDVGGRLVRRVPLGPEPGGSWQWDGRDGDGRAVPAGLYFARLASGGSRTEARVVLIR